MEKKLDKKMAKELLDKACTHIKGLYSKKKDARFDADLLMTLENGKPKFHLEFPKRKDKAKIKDWRKRHGKSTGDSWHGRMVCH